MSAKRKRSEVWNYFTIADHNKTLAKCDLCKQILSYKSSVSNLKKHIQKKHVTVSLNTMNTENYIRPVTEPQQEDDDPQPSTSSMV
jgi:hypothetical protein